MEKAKVTLKCGVAIQLGSLNQLHTYEGLLEGVPTKEMNARKIASTLEAAKGLWRSPVRLIEPVETLIEIPQPYPFGDPASIPAITCLGHWFGPAEDRGHQYGQSELTVVWFQSRFALPIAEAIVAQISELDWSELSQFEEF